MHRSVQEIATDLHDLGLMDRERVVELLGNGDDQEVPTDPAATAELLTSRSGLTFYQAEKVVSGETEDLVLGDYLIVREIGRGGMGRVYVAFHRFMERFVAVKTIDPALLSDADLSRRFHREIKMLAKLSHPNILTAHDAGIERGIPYLVTELIEGADLHQYVCQHGRFSELEAIELFRQALEAIAFAHDHGIVHRDIKPGNMMRTVDAQLKILDLGLARVIGHPSPGATTRVGQVVGTPGFMAPEQLAGRSVDHRIDVYALGRTLRFMIAGPDPRDLDVSDRETDAEQRFESRASTQLQRIYGKMVALAPDDRYSSLHDVLEDLKWIVTDASGQTGVAETDSVGQEALPPFVPERADPSSPPKSGPDRLQTRDRGGWGSVRNRVMMISSAGLVFAAVAVGAWGLSGLVRTENQESDSARADLPLSDNEETGGSKLGAPTVLGKHDGPAAFVHFSSDSSILISGGWDGTFIVWRMDARSVLWQSEEQGPDAMLAGLLYDHDSKLAVGTSHGTLQTWDMNTRACINRQQVFRKGSDIVRFLIAPTGTRRIATASEEVGQLMVWKLDDLGQAVESHRPHKFGIAGLEYDLQSEALITGGEGDSSIRWYRSGEWEVYHDGDGMDLYDLDYDSETRVLFVAYAHELIAWDMGQPAEQVFRVPAPHPETFWSIASSSDGRVLATGSRKGRVVLWDPANGNLVDEHQLESDSKRNRHHSAISDLEWSPDRRWLAAACEDSTIRVWPVKTE